MLLFYPGDETPVCTKQFCSYRDRADDMSALDAVVVGVGITPAVELAEAAGLAVDNGVLTDAALTFQ